MKRRVQPLMARDTLGYQYTGDEDTSWMPREEVDDDDIIERLGKIFKDMPPYTPCKSFLNSRVVKWTTILVSLTKMLCTAESPQTCRGTTRRPALRPMEKAIRRRGASPRHHHKLKL
jgi:hypothetical protein